MKPIILLLFVILYNFNILHATFFYERTDSSEIEDTNIVMGGELALKDTIGTIYICPMHPEIQSKNPGVCTKCGMKLTIKEPETQTHQHNGMTCMGMMHNGSSKKYGWLYYMSGAMMFIMMSFMLFRIL